MVPVYYGIWLLWYLVTVVPGYYGTWLLWYLVTMVPGYYGTWLLWYLVTMIPGYYGTWLLWYLVTMVPGYYGTWLLWYLVTMAPGYYGTWLLWFLATIVNCNYGTYLVTMVPDFTSFDAPSVSGNLGVKGGPVLHCCMYQIWHQLVPCNFTSSETSNCSSPHLFDKMFLKIASPLLLFLPLCSWMMAR